jgi:hypothetical protein
MVVLSAVVVICAFVICLALAASSSPVYGFNAKAELATRKEGDSAGRNRSLTASAPVEPVVNAAGMQ